MAKILTINDLYNALSVERAKGNGNKKILISADDEGNSFHPLFFAVSPITNDYKNTCFNSVSFMDAIKDFVIIG